MRKLNTKLLLALLLSAIGGTGAVFAIHHFQYDRIAQSMLWQARHGQEQGDVRRQALYLQRYLEFNRNDLEAKARLAVLWTSDTFFDSPRQRLRAVRLLDDVLSQGDEQPAFRRLLVKTALEVGQFKMARNHLEKLLTRDFLNNPSSSKVRADMPRLDRASYGEAVGYAGQLLEAENQLDKAVHFYELAKSYAPRVQGNFVKLALLLRKRARLDPSQADLERQADGVMDELVAVNADSSEAHLSRWHYRREFGLINVNSADKAAARQVSLDKAGQDVEQALRAAPESLEALLAVIDRERMSAQAAPLQAKSEKQADKQRQLHRDKALAYLEQGLKSQARDKPSPRRDAMRFRLLWNKANLHLDDIEWLDARDAKNTQQRRAWVSDVERSIEEIRKSRGSTAPADFLKARLYLQQRRWAEAAALLERARPTLGKQTEMGALINRYLGQCYERLAEPGQMFQAYERLRAADPDSVQAQVGMAQAEWLMGRLDKAAKLYEELRISRRMPPRIYLDRVRLEMQRQFQQEQPNWVVLESMVREAASANSEAIDGPLLHAQLCMARGQAGQARQVLKEAQAEKNWNNNAELWAGRILLELQDKPRHAVQARELLTQAKAKLGVGAVPLRLAEARLLAVEAPKDAGAAIDHLAEDAQRFDGEEEQARLLKGLADVQESLENTEAARRLLHQAAQLPSRRGDLQLQLRLFDLAGKCKDEAGMKQALDAVAAVEGRQGPFHHYGQALWLIDKAGNDSNLDQRQAKLNEAREHLDRVESIRPNWPQLFLARAQAEGMSGRKDKAIANLKSAKENGETSPIVVRRLVELLADAGRFDEADAELKSLRGTLLVQSDLGRMAAIVAVLRKDTNRASKLFADNRRADGADNYRELLWQGRMFAETKQPKEAEEKLRAALKLAPRQAEPYVALVQFLVRRQRDKEADVLLEQVRKHLSGKQMELTLGLCYEILGRRKSARQRYEAVLNEHRQDAAVVRRVAAFYYSADKPAEAEPLLRELVEGRVRNAAAADIAWARQYLALILAGGNDYGRFREALDLVGLKLDANGQLPRQGERERADSSDLRRFQARVLASQSGHRPFRQRATELLEELERNKALALDDRFILAMLYQADKAWSKAKPILRDLAGQREPAPRHLAFYVQMLIEHKELHEAARQMDRLEELEEQRGAEPNAFAAVELRARLLEEQHNGNKAIRILENHIQRKHADPDEVLLVVNALQRQNKRDEALRRCLQAWQDNKASPEVIGGASVAVLRAMQMHGQAAAPAQEQKIEQQLSNALQAKPDNAMLMLHLAELQDQCGRWQQAETLYRRVLEPEHQPRNIVALNNLAWLLAQRCDDRRKHEEALARIEAAVNGIGRRADLIDTRGMVHLRLGQEEAALMDFRDAVADVPTPTHLFHLARAHYQSSDKTSAGKILKRAVEQGLETNLLHPGEHGAYRKMLAELKVR